MMKLSIISFRTISRIVAKFRVQTNRFRDGKENRAVRNKEIMQGKPYTLAAATLRGLVASFTLY